MGSYAIDCIRCAAAARWRAGGRDRCGTLWPVHKIGLSYFLGAEGAAPLIRNPLLDLLQAVRTQGSISAAAQALGLSYRHVWGELKRWEQELGQPLLHWEKGQRARLSEFGDKLLWSERQAQARLAPQIEALRAELERTFAVAFDDSAHVLTFHASHDDALTALRHYVRTLPDSPSLHLDIRFMGSVDAIQALNEGRCIMAGFHTRPDAPVGSRAKRTYKPLLQPGLHKLIGFATRTQGLMVREGNPLGIGGLHDLTRRDVRFVNRPLGTGTRLLLDELLDEAGLAPDQIADYAQTEPSHGAVAQAVLAGQADAGLGIEAAARARGLDFVPIATEDYLLVCLESALDTPPVTALRAVLDSAAWQATLAELPGYTPSFCGQVRAMTQVLPWWQFKRPKPGRPSARRG